MSSKLSDFQRGKDPRWKDYCLQWNNLESCLLTNCHFKHKCFRCESDQPRVSCTICKKTWLGTYRDHICKDFNSSYGCTPDRHQHKYCYFKHCCINCFEKHSVIDCPKVGKSKSTTERKDTSKKSSEDVNSTNTFKDNFEGYPKTNFIKQLPRHCPSFNNIGECIVDDCTLKHKCFVCESNQPRYKCKSCCEHWKRTRDGMFTKHLCNKFNVGECIPSINGKRTCPYKHSCKKCLGNHSQIHCLQATQEKLEPVNQQLSPGKISNFPEPTKSRFFIIKVYDDETMAEWLSTNIIKIYKDQCRQHNLSKIEDIFNQPGQKMYLVFSIAQSNLFNAIAKISTLKIQTETKVDISTKKRFKIQSIEMSVKWIFIKDIPRNKFNGVVVYLGTIINNIYNSHTFNELDKENAKKVWTIFKNATDSASFHSGMKISKSHSNIDSQAQLESITNDLTSANQISAPTKRLDSFPDFSRFFIIKARDEKTMKKWLSTGIVKMFMRHNYRNAYTIQGTYNQQDIYLIFSICSIGFFNAIAKMSSMTIKTDVNTPLIKIAVKWIFIKDIPKNEFKSVDIHLEGRSRKNIYCSESFNEINQESAKKVWKIFKKAINEDLNSKKLPVNKSQERDIQDHHCINFNIFGYCDIKSNCKLKHACNICNSNVHGRVMCKQISQSSRSLLLKERDLKFESMNKEFKQSYIKELQTKENGNSENISDGSEKWSDIKASNMSNPEEDIDSQAPTPPGEFHDYFDRFKDGKVLVENSSDDNSSITTLILTSSISNSSSEEDDKNCNHDHDNINNIQEASTSIDLSISSTEEKDTTTMSFSSSEMSTTSSEEDESFPLPCDEDTESNREKGNNPNELPQSGVFQNKLYQRPNQFHKVANKNYTLMEESKKELVQIFAEIEQSQFENGILLEDILSKEKTERLNLKDQITKLNNTIKQQEASNIANLTNAKQTYNKTVCELKLKYKTRVKDLKQTKSDLVESFVDKTEHWKSVLESLALQVKEKEADLQETRARLALLEERKMKKLMDRI